ncbi:hypothetical protein CLU79DRAFT_836681 [Phycomyces nitens]|nr:hypothetical protein CLU79DRAFT_836681 [Phycomyces nitens]
MAVESHLSPLEPLGRQTPLVCMAANLSSGNDRQLYTQVIALSSTIQSRIDDLKTKQRSQRDKTNQSHTPSAEDTRMLEYFNSLKPTERFSGSTLNESTSLSSLDINTNPGKHVAKPLLSSQYTSLSCFDTLSMRNLPTQSTPPHVIPVEYSPSFSIGSDKPIQRTLTQTTFNSNPQCVSITHKINGLKGLLKRTYQLNHIILSSTCIAPGLCGATDRSGAKKVVLKLTLTTFNCPPQSNFTFHWSGRSPLLKKQLDDNRLVSLSDTLVRAQLIKWVDDQGILPPLKSAGHLFRSQLKVYIVYDRLLFSKH